MKIRLTQAFAVGALLAFLPVTVQAKNAPKVPALQSQAFALGYTLRTSELQDITFTEYVKRLKAEEDDMAAGTEVAHLSREAPKLRHAQSVAYGQVARLLVKMGGPPSLVDWANGSAAALAAPLVYSKEAQSLSKTEPDTALVLATLDEVTATKAEANAKQPSLSVWLKLNGGALAVWTAEVGSYTADIHFATTEGSPVPLSIGTARRLLQKSPTDSPAATREELAALIPHGGGNLQNLATLPPANISGDKMSRICERLLEIYVARKSVTRPEEPKAEARNRRAL